MWQKEEVKMEMIMPDTTNLEAEMTVISSDTTKTEYEMELSGLAVDNHRAQESEELRKEMKVVTNKKLGLSLEDMPVVTDGEE